MAQADPATHPAARARFELGERLYAVARFNSALEEYVAAYEIEPLPEFLLNIGECHRRLGHHEEAVFFFRGYLERAENPTDRDAVETLVAEQLLAMRSAARGTARARSSAALAVLPSPEQAPAPSPSAAPSPSENPLLAPPPAPAQKRPPLYRAWWLWTTLGVLTTGVIAVGAASSLDTPAAPLPSGTLGTIDARP